jgi:hypothetical protein
MSRAALRAERADTARYNRCGFERPCIGRRSRAALRNGASPATARSTKNSMNYCRPARPPGAHRDISIGEKL